MRSGSDIARYLICGAFMAALIIVGMPDANAQIKVVCKTATLPMRDINPPLGDAGDQDTFVVFNFTPTADALLEQITFDTQPTVDAGLCDSLDLGEGDVNGNGPSHGDPVDCDDTSVDIDELRVGNSSFQPGSGSNDTGDSVAVRAIFGNPTYWEENSTVPLLRGTKVSLVLSNDDTVNDIIVKVCAAFSTSGTVLANVTTEKPPANS